MLIGEDVEEIQIDDLKENDLELIRNSNPDFLNRYQASSTPKNNLIVSSDEEEYFDFQGKKVDYNPIQTLKDSIFTKGSPLEPVHSRLSSQNIAKQYTFFNDKEYILDKGLYILGVIRERDPNHQWNSLGSLFLFQDLSIPLARHSQISSQIEDNSNLHILCNKAYRGNRGLEEFAFSIQRGGYNISAENLDGYFSKERYERYVPLKFVGNFLIGAKMHPKVTDSKLETFLDLNNIEDQKLKVPRYEPEFRKNLEITSVQEVEDSQIYDLATQAITKRLQIGRAPNGYISQKDKSTPIDPWKSTGFR